MGDAYNCPFCKWPGMKIVSKPAIDIMNNQYKHGKCKCGAEAIYLLKPDPKVKIPHTD